MAPPRSHLAPACRRPARPARRGVSPGPVLAFAAGLALLLATGLAGQPHPAQAQFNGDFGIHKHTLDAENFLDWKAYQHPYAWRRALDTAPNLFRGSVGSLSKQVFYFAEQIRLEKRLGRFASIHYAEEEDAFFRPEPIDREVELRLGRDWSASVVGFPRHEKILGSQGYALAWGDRTRWDYVRLTRLEQFTLYNRETTGSPRFEPTPLLERLEARTFWAQRVLLQLRLRNERPTALHSPAPDDPTQALRESYEGRKADALLDVHWSPTVVTGAVWRRYREGRTRGPLDAASAVTSASQVLRLDWADVYGVFTLPSRSTIEAGVYRGAFRNDIASAGPDEQFAHRLVTRAAYVLWDYVRSDWFRWQFSLQGGRSSHSTHDGAAPDEDSAKTRSELKAGVGVILQEVGSYRAFFNTTWDLDVFTHRQWDGGNIQLLFLF